MTNWLRLDNAGKLFPSVTSDRLTHFFRLSYKLKDSVRPEILQPALERILPRFPVFQTTIRPGLFWYSLVYDASPPSLYPESQWPCMPFKKRFRGPQLFRVRYYKRRIAVELSHALTDGLGALTFLNALICEYLAQLNTPPTDWGDVFRAGDPADREESEDAFQRLFQKRFPKQRSWDRAFQVPFKLARKGVYNVTTGFLPLSALLAFSKEKGFTLTEVLTSVLLASYQDVFERLPPSKRLWLARPLRVVIPINLRKLFPSKTLRNFFVVLPVEIDLRLGHYEFDEICKKVHLLLQTEMDEKLILKQIARNLRAELNPFIRVIPLFLKNIFLSKAFSSFELQHTSSLSNLGKVQLPPEFAERIDTLEFVPPPSPYTKINCGVVSFSNTLAVTFGNQTENVELERSFFTRLRKMGFPVKIEANHVAGKES